MEPTYTDLLQNRMESLTIVVIIIIALSIPLVNGLIRKSRKACEKRVPPEAGGAWPIIGHLKLLAGPQPPHITLGNLAGPIFSIKLGVHKTLIVSNAEIAKECFTTNDKAFANRPKSLAMEILGYDYSMIGFSPYGEYWRQIRKIITLELLSKYRLEMRKHVREVEVRQGIKGLHQEWMKSRDISNNKFIVEMKKWFFDVTLNVILKIIVGQRFVEYTNESEHQSNSWQDAFREFLELAGKFAVSDALPYLRWLDLGGVEKEMKRNIEKLDRVVGKWLQQRKEKKGSDLPKEEEDFMDLLLSILNDAQQLSTRDADTINKATCLALILAASDATSVTLTWTLSLILNNREVLKTIQHELDIYVGKERQVTESDTQNFVYLQAVIKESFRLYPAVPLLVPHEAMEDCTVHGYHIPAGTRLIINASKIHKDPCLWSDPEKFQPERFLTSHKDVDFKGQNFELIPFGSGRRMCPGILFALQVLNLTLATLLHSFEIENSSDDPIDMSGSAGITNVKSSPVEVVLTPRLPAHLY